MDVRAGASSQAIRIPTFRSPTSQEKAPVVAQSRAEERAARLKVNGNNTWASLSLLAETGPASLSHLLGRREQKDATSRFDDDPARAGLDTKNKLEIGGTRASASKDGRSERGDSASRTASDVDRSKLDTKRILTGRPDSAGLKDPSSSSFEPTNAPRNAAERDELSESARTADLTQPAAVLTRRGRRPRAALFASEGARTAAAPSVPSADGAHPALNAVRASGTGNLASSIQESTAASPSAYADDRIRSSDASLAPSTDEAPPARNGKRPTVRAGPPPVAAVVLADREADSASSKPTKRPRTRRPADVELSAPAVPQIRRPRSAEIADSATAGPVSSVTSRAQVARKGARRDTAKTEAPVAETERRPLPAQPDTAQEQARKDASIRIRTERCAGHDQNEPLNPYDIIASGCKRLLQRAVSDADDPAVKRALEDFGNRLHQRYLRSAMLLSRTAKGAGKKASGGK